MTAAFLDALWPALSPGFRCVVTIRNKRPTQQFFATTEQAMVYMDQAVGRGADVYHACAMYTDASSRKAANATGAHALWMDVDVGPGDDRYPDLRTALAALQEFARAFVPPTHIVSSGSGLHLYWVTDEFIDAATWQSLACALKALAAAEGFRQDPHRTADLASILRPPGTLNFKSGTGVQVQGRRLRENYKLATLQARLGDVEDAGLTGPAPAHVRGSVNSDLTTVQHAPSHVRKVLAECRQLRESALRRGADDSEGMWYAVLRTLVRCEDATDPFLHAISSGHAQYDPGQTQAKIDHARGNGRAALCVTFEEHNPGGCDGCPHRGTAGLSPIRLGEESYVPPAVPAPAAEPIVVADESFKLEPSRYKGYVFQINGTGIEYQVWEKLADGTSGWSPVRLLSQTVYRPVRIERDHGGAGQVVTLKFREKFGSTFEATVPAGAFNDIGATADAVGNHGVGMTTKAEKLAHQSYNMMWLDRLRAQSDANVVYSRFGWTKTDHRLDAPDVFVADQAYHVGGTVEKVALSGNARGFARQVSPSGSLDAWRGIMSLFCGPNQFPQQLCAMLGIFGPIAARAPFGTPGYAPLAMVSAKGGQGKTTAATLATSAWMDPTVLSGQTDTQNARGELVATMQNLPVLLDEVTTVHPAEMAALVYDIGNGVSRWRMKQDQTMVERRDIRLPVFMTSNASLRDKLVERLKTQNEASNNRLMQLYLHKDEALEERLLATRAMEGLASNYGTAGPWWINMLATQNLLDDFMHELRTVHTQLSTLGRSEMRFVAFTLAVAVTGARWCERHRFLPINAEAFGAWAVDTVLKEQAGQMMLNVSERMMLLGEFLHEHMDSVVEATVVRQFRTETAGRVMRIVRTNTRPTYTLSPEPFNFRGRAVVARWEIFHDKVDDKNPVRRETRLLVSRKALTEFLARHKCDITSLLDDATECGALIEFGGLDNLGSVASKRPSYALSKGYVSNPPQVEILTFDPTKHAVLSAMYEATGATGDAIVDMHNQSAFPSSASA